MKKITFILLVSLISGTAFAQSSATGKATVNAEIVKPIEILLTNGTSLDFGTFTTPSEGTGSVIISPDGATRTFSSENQMKITSFNVFDVPEFTVSRDASLNTTYGIALNVVNNPTDGTTPMTLKNLKHSLSSDAGLVATSFTVGGELEVPSGQDSGVYTGQMSVTVTYE